MTTGLEDRTFGGVYQQVCDRSAALHNLPILSKSTGFSFRRSADGSKVRAYFLGLPQRAGVTSLMYADIDLQLSPEPSLATIVPQQLVNAAQLGGHIKLTKATELILERMRSSTVQGITQYHVNEPDGRFATLLNDNIFIATDDWLAAPSDCYSVDTMGQLAGLIMPKICPANSDLVAFVANNDLYVHCSTSRQVLRLTHFHATNQRLLCGTPSFIIQEEFDRYCGFWWCPTSDGQTFSILCELTDERCVRQISVIDPVDATPELMSYPRPGEDNPRQYLVLVQFRVQPLTSDGSGCRVVEDSVQRLGLRLYDMDSADWVAFLVDMGFTPSGRFVYAQCLDREQHRLEYRLWPLAAFSDHLDDADSFQEFVDLQASSSAVPIVLYSEQSRYWINVGVPLRFVSECADPLAFEFVICSEQSLYRHWYCVHWTTAGARQVTLSSGAWDVACKENSMWLDSERRVLYFVGFKDSPVERQLYAADFSDPSDVHVVRLTELGYSQTHVSLCPVARIFIADRSSLTSYPETLVYRIVPGPNGRPASASPIARIAACHVAPSTGFSSWSSLPNCTTEMLRYKCPEGEEFYGLLIKPSGLDLTARFPVLLYIYGGPSVQLVRNEFPFTVHYRQMLLAELVGCPVLIVDGRGSANRGKLWEAHLQYRMGVSELDDQMTMLRWVASQKPYIDLTRVGIIGWSYGGYLALMALAQHSDFFSVAVAGAPVTGWRLYDSAFTERYMGLPADRASAYVNGDVTSYVGNFPQEPGRLLIIHGCIDENVHLSNTMVLVAKLVEHGRPYHLLLYPRERHGLRHISSFRHYQASVVVFLRARLWGNSCRSGDGARLPMETGE